jgi:hypothetical protein
MLDTGLEGGREISLKLLVPRAHSGKPFETAPFTAV